MKKAIVTFGFILLVMYILLVVGLLLINSFTFEKPSKVTQPKTYQDLYKIIRSTNEYNYGNHYNEKATDTSLISQNYSDTNLQVLGVEEADIIKTDGNYIYAISNNTIYIVKAENGSLEISSIIKKEGTEEKGSEFYNEMYVYENKLVVVQSVSNYIDSVPLLKDSFLPETIGSSETSIVVYDITNRRNPIKLNELTQSGNYVSSRMVDQYVYLITNNYVYTSQVLASDIKTYVPTVQVNEEKTVALKDIYVTPNPNTNSYTTISGIDVHHSSDYVSTKAVFGSSSTIYANKENLYIASYTSETKENYVKTNTHIIKFSMNQGQLQLLTEGAVSGLLLNQFSMDEYEGYFRLVTTVNDYQIRMQDNLSSISVDQSYPTKTNLYVLDNQLNIVGKIEGLAPDEDVYSVRFYGNIAYFVTFRRVDPLFVADLTKSANPFIVSSLKIPGFSEYMQLYDDTYLFGLGKEADLEGRVTGVKISMFNISDKMNVKEEYKRVIGDKYSYTQASYNHKVLLLSKERSLISFPLNNAYQLYRFDQNKGFVLLGEISFNVNNDYYFYNESRGLYIENYLYVFGANQIKSFDLQTMNLSHSIDLKY